MQVPPDRELAVVLRPSAELDGAELDALFAESELTAPAFELDRSLCWVSAHVGGRLVGFVNVAFRDTQHILEIGFQILFYLTPVMYPAHVLSSSRRVGWVLSCNPLVPFLDLIRKPVLEGHAPPLSCYVTAIAVTAVLGVVAALTLGWQQRRVVHYL